MRSHDNKVTAFTLGGLDDGSVGITMAAVQGLHCDTGSARLGNDVLENAGCDGLALVVVFSLRNNDLGNDDRSSREKYVAQGVVIVSTVTLAESIFASWMPRRAARRDGAEPSTGSKMLVNMSSSRSGL